MKRLGGLLEYGCDRSADPAKNRLALTKPLSPFTILPFDEAVARVYGKQEPDRKRPTCPAQ